MTIEDAKTLISDTNKWLQMAARTPNPRHEIILKSFQLQEYKGEAFALPVSFEKLLYNPEWGSTSNTPSSLKQLIRRTQQLMHDEQFPRRASIHLTTSNNLCVLIIGP